VRRREFVTLLGGAAAAWPFAARAQQSVMPAVGILSPMTPGTGEYLLDAFRRGLGESGYVEGQNVTIDLRFAAGRFDRFPEMAADLIRRRVSVIAAFGSGTAVAAKAATQTLPILFAVTEDPVSLGLVSSLSRPGGNATGLNFFTTEVNAKRLGLLRELVPTAARIALLMNPINALNTSATLKEVEPAARTLGLQIQVFNASTSLEIDAAFAALVAWRPDALFVAPDGFFTSRRVQLAALAARHALPATYSVRDFVEVGGLTSYGASLMDAYRQLGTFVGRVLKGAKPGEMPVVQSTKFELVINAQIARMLGLTIPASLLAVADEVIE
jgi:putative tryptophan/tyrosine transport system substrate-binding protein